MKRLISLIMVLAMALGCSTAFAEYGRATPASYTYFEDFTPLYNASRAQKANIALAIDMINGMYIPYGDDFSFNDCVGPRTKRNGYVSAENGRGVNVIGGGVAQVATTMYLALLSVPDIEFDEITSYGKNFTGDYVLDGDLAVVTDYSAGTDFAFTNWQSDMTIEVWMDDDYLYCGVTLDEYTRGETYSDANLISSSCIYIDGASGLISNIERAANAINGITLYGDDEFSFNDTVGPRTEKNGYVTAMNGRGVKVVGGGVAQVASVIWLAIEYMDDISIIEKTTYGKKYNQDYVASSADAILTDYSAGTDFSFRYTGDSTIVMYVYVDAYDSLWCDIYEIDDDETITW